MSDQSADGPHPGPRRSGAALVELVVADPPEAWRAAGFLVDDDHVRLGTTVVRLVGRGDPEPRTEERTGRRPGGIRGWMLAGLTVEGPDLDGLPTTVVAQPEASEAPGPQGTAAHPNGVIGLDHVVVATPDLERTIGAIEAAGLECRRIRDTTSNGSPMRQAFFRLGPTVLEVVSGDTGNGLPASDAPATWFGLALDVDDLDATAALLGDRLGRIKQAVQPGRRIATLRHRDLGLSVSLAAMDHLGPNPDRPDR